MRISKSFVLVRHILNDQSSLRSFSQLGQAGLSEHSHRKDTGCEGHQVAYILHLPAPHRIDAVLDDHHALQKVDGQQSQVGRDEETAGSGCDEVVDGSQTQDGACDGRS